MFVERRNDKEENLKVYRKKCLGLRMTCDFLTPTLKADIFLLKNKSSVKVEFTFTFTDRQAPKFYLMTFLSSEASVGSTKGRNKIRYRKSQD